MVGPPPYIYIYSLREFLLAKYERPPGDLCVRFGGRIRVGLRGRTGQRRARSQIDVYLIGVGGVDFPLFAQFIDGIRFKKKHLFPPKASRDARARIAFIFVCARFCPLQNPPRFWSRNGVEMGPQNHHFEGPKSIQNQWKSMKINSNSIQTQFKIN